MKLHASLAAAFLGISISAAFPARADDLLSLYREAVIADANYLAAQADTQAKRELMPQARAQLLPSLSFNGSNSRNSTDQESASVKRDINYNSYSYTLGVRQPLFRANSYIAYKQSQAQVEGAEASLRWAEQEVGTRVATAYFDVLLAEAELDVIKVQRDAYQKQLDYAQKAFQAGAGSRTDIDEARSHLDLASAQAIELQYRVNYAQDALKAIINRALTPLARLSPAHLQLIRPDPDRLEDWIQMAEDVNPQLASLRAAVEVADRQVNKTLSNHLPTLDIVAERSRSKSDGTNNIGTKNDTGTVGLQFNLPIFSGGETVSTVRQAQAELDKARQQLEAARRDVSLQVRKEFDGVTQGVHWVQGYEQAVQSSEQSLLSTRKGFQAGIRSTLDILIAEQNLATARRDLNRGRYQYVLSRLRLLSLVGRLNEEEIGRFNNWLEAAGG